MKTSRPSLVTICRLILEPCQWLGGTHGWRGESVHSHLIVSGERAFKIEDNA